jgi:hypothetical protein
MEQKETAYQIVVYTSNGYKGVYLQDKKPKVFKTRVEAVQVAACLKRQLHETICVERV